VEAHIRWMASDLPDSDTGRIAESSYEPGPWFVIDWTLGCLNNLQQDNAKIVKALVIVLALILLSGMTSGKRVEAHIIVSSYIFPYLVLGSGPTQSRITKAKTITKALTILVLLLWVFLKQFSLIRDPNVFLIYFSKLCMN
jgi:hypothetical protein